MREVKMTVGSGAEGWWVDCDLPLEPTYYRSGGHAERAAGEMAVVISKTGCDVKLVILDRRAAVIATRRYFGA